MTATNRAMLLGVAILILGFILARADDGLHMRLFGSPAHDHKHTTIEFEN